MTKILNKEDFLDANGLVYSKLTLENGEIVWMANTSLNRIPTFKSMDLESKVKTNVDVEDLKILSINDIKNTIKLINPQKESLLKLITSRIK